MSKAIHAEVRGNVTGERECQLVMKSLHIKEGLTGFEG